MAYKLVSIDGVNKIAQFSITENAQSVSVRRNGIYSDLDDKMKIRLELVCKDKPNQLLYNGDVALLRSILKHFSDNLNVIPFNLQKNLILDANNYIQVTLDFSAMVEVPQKLEVSENSVIENSKDAFVVKAIPVDGTVDIDTEFYPLCLIPAGVDYMETIVMVQERDELGNFGAMKPVKVHYNDSMVKTIISNGESFAVIVLQKNQRITVSASQKNVFLMQIV